MFLIGVIFFFFGIAMLIFSKQTTFNGYSLRCILFNVNGTVVTIK